MSITDISSDHEIASRKQNDKRQMLHTIICLFIVVAAVIASFSQTIFKAAPISRVYQLGQRDTLFTSYVLPNREGYDASVYQYFVPSFFFSQRQLNNGQIPLWNPLAGCGAPFLADVETAVFNPLRLCLLWLEPMRAWNILIVLNVLNFALGTFVLSLAIGLKRYAAIFAALSCAFSPFLIFQSELIGSSSSLIPFVMAAFALAAKHRRFFLKVLSGLACGVMIISGHPEPSFFGIVCASMLYLFLSVFDRENNQNYFKKTILALIDIGLIGIFAFLSSAFMLLPFLELLSNSDCYKLGLEGHRFGVPLNSILINLIHPAYGNSSPFLGILCLPLAIYAAITSFKQDRTVRTLTLITLIAIAGMSQLGPLDALMNSRAFSWFVPKYCWPSLLIILALLSASGFQKLLGDLEGNGKRASIVVISAALIVVSSLALIRLYPPILECIRQDEAFEHMKVISKYWTKDLILVTIFALSIVASRFFSKAKASIVVFLVAGASILSLAPVAKTASPVTGPLKYDSFAESKFLESKQARIVSMGRHVFCPSSNFCYNINNIVPVNVYHPKRFQNFLIAAGVSPEGVNQFFDGRLNKAIDLAAVKYAISPKPVLAADDEVPPASSLKNGEALSWEGGVLKLDGAAIRLLAQNRELIGRLRFTIDASKATELAPQLILSDDKGNTLWLGDTEAFVSPKDLNGKSRLEISKDIAVPLPDTKGKIKLALQVFDWKQMSYLKEPMQKSAGNSAKAPLATANPESPGKVLLAEADLANKSIESPFINDCGLSKSSRKFKLVAEGERNVRIYENERAEPQARLYHKIKLVENAESALEEIQYRTSEKSDELVVEKSELKALNINSSEYSAANTVDNSDESVKFSRDNCNEFTITVNSKAPAILLVAENYYPGWTAKLLSGNKTAEAKILHGNYLFQAVCVPKGESTVKFSFQPQGFVIGSRLLIAAIITAIGSIAYALLRRKTGQPL